MHTRHLVISALMAVLALGLVLTRSADPGFTMRQAPPPAVASPNHLTHPCDGLNGTPLMLREPPFTGVSPLSITWVPGTQCTGDVFSAAFGDIAVWQAGGHSYVGISGFAQRSFFTFNVDDPVHPQVLHTEFLPSSNSASLTVFAWKQGANRFLSVGIRGLSPACGFFVYNVNDPANPQFVARKQGADWCTVHEHFVSTDANGDADYAWLTMSAEQNSGYKIVAVDLRSLPTLTETGRYQRPDAGPSIFAHDSTVVGTRVFVDDWAGGLQIFDKETLAHNINPTPLNPLDSIRPSGFNVHHSWPTSDGNHVFVEDEFLNTAAAEKVKLYNISNIAAPFYESGIVGPSYAPSTRAHNLKILNQSPGHDLLFVGWYQGGTRGFDVDTTVSPPAITERLNHHLNSAPNNAYGDVWGVDYLPCTVAGQNRTCIYSSDLFYGLYIDALGTDPALDPYPPESAITDPTNGQTIAACTYTIQGNAHDYWSGVSSVDVSTDNGATWQPAQGTSTWSYTWTIPADGSYALKARAHDQAGNLEAPPATINVTVNGSCGALTATPVPPSATPVPTTPTAVPNTPTAVPAISTPPPATSTAPAATSTPAPPQATNTPGPPAATATAVPCTITFADVQRSDYFYEPVRFLTCRSVVSGYGDNTFRPYNNTTRSQLMKIVVNGLGTSTYTPPGGAHTFTDVPTNHPFFSYVETGVHAGLISGYNCGGPGEPCDAQNRPYFRPYASVTRGQVTKIVVGAAGWTPLDPSSPTFADVAPGSAFYTYVETASARGIISGYACGSAGEPCDAQHRPYFRQFNTAVRGQIAKIVYGAIQAGPAR